MQLRRMAAATAVTAGVSGIVAVAAVPVATAQPSPSASATASASPSASPTRAAVEPALELRGLPGEFVPGGDWREFTAVLHHGDPARQFDELFFQVHDILPAGLKVDQIEVQYFQDGRWRSTASDNDPEDHFQDYPVPAEGGPVPADVTEIPVRLKFRADAPLTDRIDIGLIAGLGPTEAVRIQPLKVIRLVAGTPTPTGSPTATPTGNPTPTGTPSPDPTATGGPEPSPTATATATATGDPGSPGPSGSPSPSATPAPGGGAGTGPGAEGSDPAAPAPGGELARTGADSVGTPLVAGLVALGAGSAVVLAARVARARRRRH
ncbi:hypothetical protein AB0O91_16190 [Kitasatospora sp. NPDC089797]|uniref:hypothetical protein n=1 Tax=Kitasatospora sp. NPDC089797 TaxID=3155298 RepID=UPI0034278C39